MKVVSLARRRAGLDLTEHELDGGAAGSIPALYPRPRLADWLTGSGGARIILLHAPGGFGKSVILNQWADARQALGGVLARIMCRETDQDSGHFLRQLAAAFESIGAAVDPAVKPTRPARRTSICGQWAASIQALGRVDLFVDEEAVKLAAESLSLLWELAMALPQLRVFVASRRKLTAGLARAHAQGQVALLDGNQIAMDRTETRGFFEAAGMRIEGEYLDAVFAHTAGWPLALRILAEHRGDGPSAAKAAAALAGKAQIVDFFVEEVMVQLSAEARTFLSAVAILDRLSPALCDAVTGLDNGEAMLDRLSNDGLFVLRIDDGEGWCRLHPALAAYLRKHASGVTAKQRRQHHLRAQAWFEQAGHFIEAFDHAMRGGDSELAARVLSAHCDDLYMAGFERSILPASARLPTDVRQRFPRIMLAMSWRMMVEWRFESAAALLESAEERFREMRACGGSQDAEFAEVEHEIKHRRIMQGLFTEDFTLVDREGQLLLRDVAQRCSPYFLVSLYAAVMYAQREQFHLGSLERFEALGREHLQDIPSRYLHVFFEAMAAPGRLLRGETDMVIDMLQAALQTAIDISGRGSAVPATVALTLSEALYTRNEVDSAQALLAEYLPYATDAGFVDQLISGYITQARLQRRAGCFDAGVTTLQEAETFAAERELSRLGAMAFSERIALLCHAGRADEAIRAAEWRGLNLLAAPAAPTKGSTRAENAIALAWVRLAQARGQITTALSVAKAWRNHTGMAKAVASVVEWDILRAQLLLAANDETGAQRAILQALAIAAPARRVRPFVDEATRLLPIFEALSAPALAGTDLEKFAATVLSAIALECGEWNSVRCPIQAVKDEGDSTGDLTVRELSILKMAAAGYLNVEIGKSLGLTSGTVKWYLHRIYSKLGCRRRIKAIDQGRRLGLIK